VVADLMRFFGSFHRERYGWAGPPIHDAVAVAVLVAPWLIERRTMRVDVELGEGLARGRTIGDERGVGGKAPNADVLVRLDRPAFIDLLVEAIATFP
jgi:inosine-uridine nucleoside N-ribohydrolase